jgi:glycosyltransferase involved in cell wall biosynthesis
MSVDFTIIIPNKNRLFLPPYHTDQSNFLIKGLQNQSKKDFKLIIIDGGSDNYEIVKSNFEKIKEFEVSVLSYPCKWNKCFLNNYAIRRANTNYIMCTDADIFFEKQFVEYLSSHFKPDLFLESRTMYWKWDIFGKITRNELNPLDDIESCRHGKLKRQFTCGGCQCGHINIWNKVRGYDERYEFGCEDQDLVRRVSRAGFSVYFIDDGLQGKTKLFHMPHEKIDPEGDSQKCSINKRTYFRKVETYEANKNGWGGLP